MWKKNILLCLQFRPEVRIYINHETGATKLVYLKNLSPERERERDGIQVWSPWQSDLPTQ